MTPRSMEGRGVHPANPPKRVLVPLRARLDRVGLEGRTVQIFERDGAKYVLDRKNSSGYSG